ncbi:hypothetical protein B0H16DRAFT_1628251 [Mycena metata]|uniref:Uncharacterized protein n=1 Tax=Mycena metata TaxID=1033252 RepID=A0AAD7H454_9AGAR|nr:hypothetical protein B0H16DRAFT_1628251 [Mycena metata]
MIADYKLRKTLPRRLPRLQSTMPCAGKDGQGCNCLVFNAKEDKEDPSVKCAGCKHRKKYHTVTAPSGGGGGLSNVLAQYDIARLQTKKGLEENARNETNRGFRGGGKDKSVDLKGKTAKAGSSKMSAKNSTMVKIGSIQLIAVGVDADNKPLIDKCPTTQEVEEMVDRGLAVYRAPDGDDLEVDLKWNFARIDAWIRAMLKPKSGCGVFDFLDARYGVPEGERDSHWVLAAKNSRKVFVKRGPINGELLDTVKGTASGHRKYKEHTVRILSRHRIPFTITKDWNDAVHRVTSGEEVKSESESDPKRNSKPKGKGCKSQVPLNRTEP